MAPARFTKDSRASESNTTYPVKFQANIFRAMVRTAAVIDSQTKGFREPVLVRAIRPMVYEGSFIPGGIDRCRETGVSRSVFISFNIQYKIVPDTRFCHSPSGVSDCITDARVASGKEPTVTDSLP
jgi:hypothetical protein